MPNATNCQEGFESLHEVVDNTFYLLRDSIVYGRTRNLKRLSELVRVFDFISGRWAIQGIGTTVAG